MCYACDACGFPDLSGPFRSRIPGPCEDEDWNADDVVRPGALEGYWAGLLGEEARRAFVEEVRHAEEDQNPNVARVIISPNYRYAEGYARSRGWNPGRDRLVYLTPDTPFGVQNALRGIRRPKVYRLDRTRMGDQDEAFLARLEPLEMPVEERWSRESPALDVRHGYSAVVDTDGNAVVRAGLWSDSVTERIMEGFQDVQVVVDEAAQFTLGELEEAARRIMAYGRNSRVSWLPMVANPSAPTAGELAQARPLASPDREIDWESPTAPGADWRASLENLEADGPSNSSGMPFSWASTLERHPGWNSKDQTLRVYASPYEDRSLVYRRDELEEDLRWL